MGLPGISIIAAPTSLGLRPFRHAEPGAWRAPEALLAAGLAERVRADDVTWIAKPTYSMNPQPATRIRNGAPIRVHALSLADAVARTIGAGLIPLVLGGDCSVLLGSLCGARRGGRAGLVHLDGHADFYHPGNYDTALTLGSVAGMDLALATGRGELLLTDWPLVGGPLVEDGDVVQLGDREADPASAVRLPASIRQIPMTALLGLGADAVLRAVADQFAERRLDRIWLHVDLDVLDRRSMPAVDSPGSPGLDFDQLRDVIAAITNAVGIVGVDVTIYDPDRDRRRRYAPRIVDCLARGLRSASPKAPRRSIARTA